MKIQDRSSSNQTFLERHLNGVVLFLTMHGFFTIIFTLDRSGSFATGGQGLGSWNMSIFVYGNW